MTKKVKQVTSEDQLLEISGRLSDALEGILGSQTGVTDEEGNSITVSLLSLLMVELAGFLQMTVAIGSGRDPRDEVPDMMRGFLQTLEAGVNKALCDKHQIDIVKVWLEELKGEMH